MVADVYGSRKFLVCAGCLKQDKVAAAAHDEEAKTERVADADRGANAVVVDSNDDKIDTVAAVVESKDDKVVENDKVPQVCDSKADVEPATEAHSSSNSSSALQKSASQSLPLDSTRLHRKCSNELLSKLSTCQAKRSSSRQSQCSNALLCRWSMPRTWIRHRSTLHSGCQRKRLRRGASQEPCDSSWSESGSRRRLDAGTCEPVLSLLTANVTSASEPRTKQIPARLEDETVLKTVGVDDAFCPVYFTRVTLPKARGRGTVLRTSVCT